MSSQGSPAQVPLNAEGISVAIVAATWHSEIVDNLVNSASRFCTDSNARVEVFRVPGSFEIPLGASLALDNGFDAVIALGVIIRGDTPHFEYVSSGVTTGLMELMLQQNKPIGFGILTCDNETQAFARSGLPGSTSDKGIEAAGAALELAILARSMNHDF
jgi:6,7-dimethyl-8-ribityllumazine synthase